MSTDLHLSIIAATLAGLTMVATTFVEKTMAALAVGVTIRTILWALRVNNTSQEVER